MIIMKDSVGFIDWSRAAITDWILDGLVKFPIRLFSQEKLQNLENSIKNVETKPFQRQKNEKSQTPLIFLFENGTFYLVDILDNQK